MTKKLCAALLCLLMAGLWGCGEQGVEELPEEVFTEAITKIDLSAPGSKKYRDWLEKYFTEEPLNWDQEIVEPSSTRSKTPKPDIKTSKEVNGFFGWHNFTYEGAFVEGWRTWDWNDTWEAEAYTYKNGNAMGWFVLRAHNKDTGETLLIDEVAGDIHEDNGVDFQVICIEEDYIVYRFGSVYNGWFYGFYSTGPGGGLRISTYMGKGFLDAERTKWWFEEYANMQEDFPPRRLNYLDFRKLAAGDADWRHAVFGEGQNYNCINGWMAQRDGRDVACFLVLPIADWESGYSYTKMPLRFAIFDPLEGRVQKFLELPVVEYHEIAEIAPGGFYYFDSNYDGGGLSVFFRQDEYARDRKELDYSAIDFYVINL